MVIALIIAALAFGILGAFSVGFLNAVRQSVKAWWYYRKICIPVSAFCFIVFGIWFLVPAIPNGAVLLLNLLVQFIIGSIAWAAFDKKLKKEQML